MQEHAASALNKPLPGAALGDELLPKQFGKYTLLYKLSAGGMAEIFLALQRSLVGFEKLVVVKRILPAMNQDRSFVDMLLHEARIAATLSHPNIVQTFDAGEIEGTYYIAMEHIHGEDVHAVMRAGKKRGTGQLPLEHMLSIMLGVCAGLAYMHDKRDLGGVPLGIVHRDISTRNIVVSFNGDVKIVDFGIAKSQIEDTEDQKEQQLKGKIQYMSPEQVTGAAIDWRTDIFAAGVVLFELTTGKRLFKGASDVETLLMIRDGEYTRPSQINLDYPPALERIVLRALQKRREDRYQSAREMQADLEQFIRDERIPVSPVSLSSWMQFLFEEKLARHKEALQGVKQLVNVITTQQKRWTMEMNSGITSTAMSAAPANTSTSASSSTASLPAPARGNLSTSLIPVASAIALVGGFMYMQHEMSLRQAEILKMYREEQGIRQQPVPQVELKGSLEIASKPAGCAIWLNGDLRPEVTPAKLDNLPLGRELHVKLTKDGLEAYRTKVKLSEDAPFKEIDAEMRKTTATVVLRVDPPSAVWLDGKVWKGDRSRIEGLSPGEEHNILIAANGYSPKTIHVTAQAGETKTFSIQLQKADPAPAKSGAAPQPSPR